MFWSAKYLKTCCVLLSYILIIFAAIQYVQFNIDHNCPNNHNAKINIVKDQLIPLKKLQEATTALPINTSKILEITRIKIKNDLSNFQITDLGINRFEDLLIDSGGKPMRSIIISTWRSGSTFLGDILNSIPANFYTFEPLLNYTELQVRGPPVSESTLNTIKYMMQCQYNHIGEYFQTLDEYGITSQCSRNSKLWEYGNYSNQLCSNKQFLTQFCRLFPFQSMKFVRLRLLLVPHLLNDTELNVKVVYLIRDPRGVMQSRVQAKLCKEPDCAQPVLLCADMISDYMAARRILQDFPNRLMIIRFEELALDPYGIARRMVNFLQLDGGLTSVFKFLDLHTNTHEDGHFKTFRISSEIPFKWKRKLSFKEMNEIQLVCKDAMNLWGYKMADNETHMKSKDFNPLGNFEIN